MKKTTITRNRSIIFTRIWSARLAVTVPLFFILVSLACTDNELTLGFPREPKSFEVFYEELPLTVSQVLADSMSTYNEFYAAREKRLLMGSYADPLIGTIRAETYTHIRPSNTSKVLETGAVYDSVTMSLLFDYYHYGSRSTSPQTFGIHELTEVMELDYAYDNRSRFSYNSLPLAQPSVAVNPARFDQIVDEGIKDTTRLRTTLPVSVGQKLFDIMLTTDSTFTNQEKFVKAFKGFAILPQSTDKILGVNPSSTLSKVEIHYHVDAVKYSYAFYFDYGASFSRIEADRSGTDLASMVTPGIDYEAKNGKSYSQSGTGLFSKLNFQSLITKKEAWGDVVFNSVELIIPVGNYETSTPPPPSLGLRVVDNQNDFYLSSKLLYDQYLTNASTGNEIIPVGVYARNDLGLSSVLLTFNEDTRTYSGFITQFAQDMVQESDPKERFLNFVLFSMKPDANKAVDRFYFNTSDVK